MAPRAKVFVVSLLLAALMAAAVVSPAMAVEAASAPAAEEGGASAGPSLADKIKHVVILMLENRSFVRRGGCQRADGGAIAVLGRAVCCALSQLCAAVPHATAAAVIPARELIYLCALRVHLFACRTT